MDDVLTSKILSLVLLGGVSIILGFIPMKLGKLFKGSDGNPRHGTILSSLLCFGGGVLLATSLLHMLPEVRHCLSRKPITNINLILKLEIKSHNNILILINRFVKASSMLKYHLNPMSIFHLPK